MLRSLVNTASRLFNDLNRSFSRHQVAETEHAPATLPPAKLHQYERLERVLLTDEVNRTILEEFAAHRDSERGEEETGWVLLGVRDLHEATVLATLPAGTHRDA